MSERPQLLYCQDILESGTAIQSYVKGLTRENCGLVDDCRTI